MANVNKVILIGRLTRKPELRYTQTGMAVCEFGFAVNRKWRSEAGDEREETMFIQVVCWNKQAEAVAQYLDKGSTAYVEGRITLDEWEDRNTQQKRQQHKVTADIVQFLDRKGNGDGGRRDEQRDEPRGEQRDERSGGRPANVGDDPAYDRDPAPVSGGQEEFDLDEDVPF